MNLDRPGKMSRASSPTSRSRRSVQIGSTGWFFPATRSARHTHDAEGIAEALDVSYDAIHLQPLLNHVGDLAPERVDLHGQPIVTDNLVARLRMTMAYLTANATRRLVVGTTNRSELLLGYFTKYGDGASGLLPIGDLYKTEVKRLARDLGVPEFVLEKPPTAGIRRPRSVTRL